MHAAAAAVRVIHYRVVGPRFCCALAISDGRVQKSETAPYLRRLAGLKEAAVMQYAAERRWVLERMR